MTAHHGTRAAFCAGALLMAAVVARADVAIIQVPAAAAARGIALQSGDVLRAGDDPTRLDAFRLLELEALGAPLGAVSLQRLRGGALETVTLAAGRWELIAVPLNADGSAPTDLEAALAQAQARGANDAAAALQLALGQLAANAGDFAAATGAFDAAAALLPTRADWIAQVTALSLEAHPDRNQPLRAAERAVELRRTGNIAPLVLAGSLQQLALWRAQTRDNAGAKLAADEALRLAPETLVAARAHLVLSFVAMRGGQSELAAEELRHAEQVLKRIAPTGLDAALLLARRALLSALRREGDSASAAYLEALVELRRLAPGSMLLGRTLFNAESHAFERRRYAEAEALAREAMAVFAAVAPGGLEYGQARAALADVLMRRTEYAQAEALLREAAQAADLVDAQSYEALSLKLQLGGSLARQARYADALLLYDTVERTLAATDAPVALAATSLRADTALYRGDVLTHLDRCPEALASASAAIARYREQDRPGIQRWQALLILSECQRRAGAWPLAIEHAQQAAAGLQAIAGAGIQVAAAQIALARAERDRGHTDAAIAAYLAAIDGLELHRERVGGSDEIRAQWEAQYQDYYKELLWLLAAAGRNEAVLEFEARYRRQALLQLLGEGHADLASNWAPKDARSMPAAVALPDDSALLSFVVGREGTLALLQTPGGAARTIVLPTGREQLSSTVDRLLLLGARPSDNALAIDALQSVGQDLHTALIAPLLDAISAYPRWIVVADGPLLRVPWAALVVRRNPLRYLVEERVLAVAPSIAVWAALAERGAAADSILAFADPSLGRAHSDPLRNASLTALPGARREVDALAEAFPGRVKTYLGGAATEAQVRASAPAAGAIHFALHSVIDAAQPMASHIVLANGADGTERNDGRLRADEIAGELQLRADLVVLSSCASAIGVEAGGAGLLGLTRALHLAGARAVIGTTWPVGDLSTARLMADFYRQRNAGTDSAAALAAAQRAWLVAAREHSWSSAVLGALSLQESLPSSAEHPFFWAGFVHSGASAR